MGNPILRYEAGQTVHAFEALSDSGDATTFESSFYPWSKVLAPTVVPAGLKTGGAITAHASNDTVSIAALSAAMPWVTGADSDGAIAVNAGTLVALRGSAGNICRITSLTVNNLGALEAVAGDAHTAFSETRGALGGPPLIDDDAIEIGQVRLGATSAAVVASDEIFTVIGTHRERYDYPSHSIDYATGEITFSDSLALIHTDGESDTDPLPKMVYAKGYTPSYAKLDKVSDWAPSETSYSTSSTDTYDGPVGATSSSLGQASFTAIVKDGVSDSVIAQKGKNLWFEFRPDRDKLTPKQLTQGLFGISRTFPAGGGSISMACTISPENATTDVAE